MPRFIRRERPEALAIKIDTARQLYPGTFEHAVDRIVEKHLDLSVFDARYHNDRRGRKAINPKVLLKIILVAYSRGITTSRKMAAACRENVVFMVLSDGATPDFTTLASFVSSMSREIVEIFCDVLVCCSELDLIGGEIFATDGCKISSNAAKEWSGTFNDLEKKREKFRRVLEEMMVRHRTGDGDDALTQSDQRRREALEGKIDRIAKFLRTAKPKMGAKNSELQSNITDNESAKMKTCHGTLQGYTAVATVDAKNQIIVYAEAFGVGQEHDLLKPMVEGTKRTLEAIGRPNDNLEGTAHIADSGYHSKENCAYAEAEKLDAYIPDNQFRKRDVRFADAERHKPERQKDVEEPGFQYDAERDCWMCPMGKELELDRGPRKTDGFIRKRYAAREEDCAACPMRGDCLRKNAKRRTISPAIEKLPEAENACSRMRDKIDTPKGREMYSKRMGIVEPTFGNITYAKRINRFTLRGKAKVTIQWMLCAIVHNIEKISRVYQVRHAFG